MKIIFCGWGFALSAWGQAKAPSSPYPAPYSLPLRFEVLGDAVETPPLELEYDLTTPGVLKMGGIDLKTTNFFAALLDSKSIISRDLYFVFMWPELLIPEGQLEMISRSGRVVWKLEVTSLLKQKWKESIPSLRAKNPRVLQLPLGIAMPAQAAGNPFFAQKEPYRFCLSKTMEQGYTRLCTPLYESRFFGSTLRVAPMAISASPPRVIAFNESAPLKNSVVVEPHQTVQFYAEIESGISLEFVAQPARINLVEMVRTADPKTARLVAWGERPIQISQDLSVDTSGYFTKLFNWQQTIGDFRDFWETSLSLDRPVIYLPGSGGGIFKQKFVIKKLPSEEMRPYADSRTPRGTYVDNSKIFIRKTAGIKVSTQQNSVKIDSDEKEFTWYFGATERGQLNKSYLLVRSADEEFRVYTELFKGYPRELSARMSGIVSSEGKLVLVGELSFQYWFEDILGWSQYYLAKQRWGLSLRYFQSLTDFSLGSKKDMFRVTTGDLKYRLTPGLWNRDESWGAILGFEKVQYLTFDAMILGGGAFWARSMPKVFDDVFNLAWFMRYPKWVDMEFIYYLMPMDAQTKVNFPNYALNFHGKVMWTPSFFGEAGFGIKQYNIDDKRNRLNMKFGSLYGTVGVGLNF